jgi:hypothetical protein
MADEAVRAYEGTQAQAEVLCTMLNARGIPAQVTFDHEVEGGTAMVEAIIFVPPDQLEDARALIADVLSGAAERKGSI